MKLRTDQCGFALIFEIIVITMVLLVVAIVLFRGSKKTKPVPTSHSQTATKLADPNEPPLKLKSIGFNLDYYNPATGMAGDIKFAKYNFFNDEIWGDFGQQDPRTPDPTKKNPQPSFYVSVDAPVLSLVDGEVINIQTLYSGDVSIMVAKNKSSPFIYETEHVINPKVRVGDKVKGGQVIASVSPHGSPGPGVSVLEIGILNPHNGVAGHLCPYKYLDDSIKEDIGKKITALHTAWESYIGKKVYFEPFASPGCVTESWVKG